MKLQVRPYRTPDGVIGLALTDEDGTILPNQTKTAWTTEAHGPSYACLVVTFEVDGDAVKLVDKRPNWLPAKEAAGG